MKKLSKLAERAPWHDEPETGVWSYVGIGVALVSVAVLIRMAPELRRYLKMRGM